jgi:class 3 adenylate cyclase
MPNPRILGERKKATQVIACVTFRFLTAVDVEGFSRRSAAEQAKIQDDLEHAMSEAATSADLDRRRWYRQPCGDGELAVLPPVINCLSLVADYPRRLALMLAEINRSAEPGSRLRVRMAIHHGTVSPGRFGPVGRAPIVVARLVDAQVLRQQLRQRNDLDIALIVSAAVY